MAVATSTGTSAHPVADLRADDLGRMGAPAFHNLQAGRIFAVRDVPEIHELTETIHRLAADLGGPAGARGVSDLLRGAEVPSLEALSVFYRTVRHLRDSRFLGCLFSDFLDGLGLPAPVLVDAGYFRIMIPRHYRAARDRPDLFDAAEFGPPDPHETEQILQDERWGSAHRDIDARHYHFQLNFWFPLHDVDEKQTLLLFPDAYRRHLPQYGKLPGPEAPSEWGFGRALQVALRSGDMLMFHSQHLHASPSQSPGSNRFSVEIRAAAACVDDNGRVYRRSFWNLGNFRAAGKHGHAVSLRSAQLAQPAPDRPDLHYALAGATGHAVVHRLFRRAHLSLTAGYLHRHDDVLDDAVALDAQGWRSVVARLREFPCGEDLWLLVARLLLRQRQPEMAVELLSKVCSGTSSYFWALEAGRIAGAAGFYETALSAFRSAADYAGRSDIALDRYTPAMPPPRHPVALQLLPARAKRAAEKFARQAERLRSAPPATADPSLFDHRYFWDPSLVWPRSPRGRRIKESVKRVLGPAASGFVARIFRFLSGR